MSGEFNFSNKKKVVILFKYLEEIYFWWDNANLQKNKGFYVDYTKSIETPMQVTEAEYEAALLIVEKFHSQIRDVVRLIESFSDE